MLDSIRWRCKRVWPLRRAAREVQAGDVEWLPVSPATATDRQFQAVLVVRFSRCDDASYPYGSGGPKPVLR